MRLMLWMALIAAPLWLVVRAAAPGEPELISVFPFGGQQGTDFKVTIRGRSLDRVSAVWFDCEHLSATIAGVENDKAAAPIASKRKKKSSSAEPLQLLTVAVKVAPQAAPGVHYLRVLAPRGISNALPVRVHSEPGILEDVGRHNEPAAAQQIPALPVVINGSLPGGGEVDYYLFEAQQGETLLFDAVTAAGGHEAGFTLFTTTGSLCRPGLPTIPVYNDGGSY